MIDTGRGILRDIKERTTAEHGPSMVRVPEDEVHLRLEPCSAVVTGILGVHTGNVRGV